MRKKLFGMLLMLCCLTIVAGGCAKKAVVKEDESLAQERGSNQSETCPNYGSSDNTDRPGTGCEG